MVQKSNTGPQDKEVVKDRHSGDVKSSVHAPAKKDGKGGGYEFASRWRVDLSRHPVASSSYELGQIELLELSRACSSVPSPWALAVMTSSSWGELLVHDIEFMTLSSSL